MAGPSSELRSACRASYTNLLDGPGEVAVCSRDLLGGGRGRSSYTCCLRVDSFTACAPAAAVPVASSGWREACAAEVWCALLVMVTAPRDEGDQRGCDRSSRDRRRSAQGVLDRGGGRRWPAAVGHPARPGRREGLPVAAPV